MTASWVSMGTTSLWATSDGGPWFPVVDSTLPSNPKSTFFRIGGNEALKQESDKVVRGFRLTGAMESPPVAPMTLALLRGLLPQEMRFNYPSKQVLDASNVDPSANRYGFDWRVNQTHLPIGLIPRASESWADVTSPAYAGPRSIQPVQLQSNAAGGGLLMRAAPVTLDLLVSDRPVVSAMLPRNRIRSGETMAVDVSIGYGSSSADPIQGVPLAISASVGTVVSGDGVNFGARAVVNSDANGISRFTIKGVSGTTQPMPLYIDIDGDVSNSTLQSRIGRMSAGIVESTISTPMSFIRECCYPQLPYWINLSVDADPPYPSPGRCAVYPEIAAIPGTPSRTSVENDFGWNCGANSEQFADGDFELMFNEIGFGNIGAVIGIVPSRSTPVTEYQRITHGFYFSASSSGRGLYSIMESGRIVYGSETISRDSSRYKIQRVDGNVAYYIDDELIFTSRVKSIGEAIIGASLYATKDSLPSTTPEGGCFWTQLQRAAQECGGGSSGITPPTEFNGFGNNANFTFSRGGMEVESLASFGAMLFEDGGEWKIRLAFGYYYPNTDLDDTASGTLSIYRIPRNLVDFPGDPFNWQDWAEYVGQVEYSNLPIISSRNGGMRSLADGVVTGVPSLDPSYVYAVQTNANVVSGGSIVDTPYLAGSIIDTAAVGAGQLAIKTEGIDVIPTDTSIAQKHFPLFSASVVFIRGENEVLVYTEGAWSATWTDPPCGVFEASIDGQPPIDVEGVCS